MKTVGIDVSLKTLAVAFAEGERVGKAREFANDASGHALLIKALKNARVERVCLEGTGTYHLDLALALDAAGVALMVVNPKVAKRFAEERNRGQTTVSAFSSGRNRGLSHINAH